MAWLCQAADAAPSQIAIRRKRGLWRGARLREPKCTLDDGLANAIRLRHALAKGDGDDLRDQIAGLNLLQRHLLLPSVAHEPRGRRHQRQEPADRLGIQR